MKIVLTFLPLGDLGRLGGRRRRGPRDERGLTRGLLTKILIKRVFYQPPLSPRDSQFSIYKLLRYFAEVSAPTRIVFYKSHIKKWKSFEKLYIFIINASFAFSRVYIDFDLCNFKVFLKIVSQIFFYRYFYLLHMYCSYIAIHQFITPPSNSV